VLGVVVVRFLIDNLDQTLRFYNEVRVFRSTTGEGGAYTEVTSVAAGDRILLVAGQLVYEYADPTGLGTYWYRAQLANSQSGATSVQFEPQRADGQDTFDVLSVDELKINYLTGLDLTDDDGNELPDSMYEHYLRSAVALAERRLDLPIRRRVFDADAIDGGVDGSGGETERLDFTQQEYYKYIWLQVEHFPIISVEEIKLVLPNEQEVINFDTSWLNVKKDAGQIMIIPQNGSIGVTVLGQSGAWLPLIYGWTDFIPDVFRIKYTAGFVRVPADIKNLIGMMASLGPLAILGDLILGAGIASERLGMDGLVQEIQSTASATNSGYGARIRQYQREIREQTQDLRRYYKGVQMMVA
jgi:hypothetical protein